MPTTSSRLLRLLVAIALAALLGATGLPVLGTATVDAGTPPKPMHNQVLGTNQSWVKIGWNKVSDPDGIDRYEVFRNNTYLGKTTGGRTYYDWTVAAGRTYRYKVRAVDERGNKSAFSNIVSATVPGGSAGGGTPPPPPPPPPTSNKPTVPQNVRLVANAANAVKIAWNASSDPDGIRSYDIYRNGSWKGWSTSRNWTDTSAAAGATYRYTVVALDTKGNWSGHSAELRVTVANNAPPPPPSGNGNSMWFGAYVKKAPGKSQTRTVDDLQNAANGNIDLIRDFLPWNSVFPSQFHRDMKNRGKRLMVSVAPTRLNGSNIRWRDIANAQPGSSLHNEMKRWGQVFRDWGQPIYVIFTHEPDVSRFFSGGGGSPADFRDAYRKFVTIVRNQGATNVEFMLVLSNVPFDNGSADQWYPGDAYVDHIGGDFYNWYKCYRPTEAWSKEWKSLEDRIEAFRVWGRRHPGKGLWLTEFASNEDSSSTYRKRNWMRDARALFKGSGYEQFEGAIWFSASHDIPGTSCRWYADSSGPARTAFGEWLRDPFWQGN